MTVEEAKTKECIARIWNGDGDGFSKCTANDCMAWRWSITLADGAKGIPPMMVSTTDGYCGMVPL